jgi:hypothetical protein
LLATETTNFIVVYQSEPQTAQTAQISEAIKRVLPESEVTQKTVTLMQSKVIAWDNTLVTYSPWSIPIWIPIVACVAFVAFLVACVECY